jgi:hypothetical protein
MSFFSSTSLLLLLLLLLLLVRDEPYRYRGSVNYGAKDKQYFGIYASASFVSLSEGQQINNPHLYRTK